MKKKMKRSKAAKTKKKKPTKNKAAGVTLAVKGKTKTKKVKAQKAGKPDPRGARNVIYVYTTPTNKAFLAARGKGKGGISFIVNSMISQLRARTARNSARV